ncbi:ABC-F family ATP-binding cassette domain-containing protein [Compostibacter hankyongensis]|uniref:ABC-F family ATP-binding cassette domain-containing protein n=1 Tax=Compostibacter hankyongensis TaxID=1007089 RepID=A0ABP8FFQ5_9BACT
MHYVSAEGLNKSYGVQSLFSGISFHIEEGDKIALIARNGAGKSTLLKILAGRDTPDEGTVWVHKDVTVAFLDQETRLQDQKSVIGNIFDHDHPVLNAIREYEALLDGPAPGEQQMAAAIARMDELGAWQFEARVKQILGKLQIRQLQQPAGTLSGGQRKRVALARTLIDAGFEHRHTLLILDEPTNHLDVEMIEWLEQYLKQEKVTLFLVTHDRYFLDHVCNEIWELDDERLYTYRGDYEHFLEKKSAREEAEKASTDKARNLLRKELDWMLRQPKARSTKARARIDAFHDLKEKATVKTTEGNVSLQVKMSRLGGKILELKKVYKSYGDKIILKGFDYTFKKGERIGIIGKNGAGKSTFLDILMGNEPADSGKVNTGDTVIFGYYNQQGLEVKEDKRVIEFVKAIAEHFPLADGTKVSAARFLELFLFPPEKQYTYISKLSGGEKRRLHLLSILFRNPNFLILDEPTNDLDIQTLNVLEDFLQDFPGCVVIVSHDRYFMDRLIDHLFAFEGEGSIRDFPGNYSQYREAESHKQKAAAAAPSGGAPAADRTAAASGPQKKKLAYHEKRELEQLEQEMPQLEQEKKSLEEKIGEGSLSFEALHEAASRIGTITALLDEKELRWLELDERR